MLMASDLILELRVCSTQTPQFKDELYSTLVGILCYRKKCSDGWRLTPLFLNHPLVKVCLNYSLPWV